MNFIQKQSAMIKILLYFICVFGIGFVLSIILGLLIPTPDDIADWQFSLAFVLAFLSTGVVFMTAEHNGLVALREKALACKNDIISIQSRMEDLVFQLESLMISHMEHEKDIYLKVSKNDSRRYKKLRTLGEIRTSLTDYPHLRSDETVMKLFNEISSGHNSLLNCRLNYNSLASSYNSGIHKFPAAILRKMWKLEPLEYLNPEDDTLIKDSSTDL